MSNLMDFIEIKPNSDKNINNSLLESINKLLIKTTQNITSSEFIDEINDIYTDHDESIICHKKDNMISFINNFFKSNHTSTTIDQITASEQNIQYYDIISFDFNFNKPNELYLMLIDKNINSSAYLTNINEDERKKKFNLLASTLSKYHTNSHAIFGSCFIIAINKKYYLDLESLDKLKEQQDKTPDDEYLADAIEKYNNKLNELNKSNDVYYKFTSSKLIESFANVCFVKIFSSDKKTYIYSRDLLENFIGNINTKITIISEEKNIIKLTQNNTNQNNTNQNNTEQTNQTNQITIYCKCIDPLPNSHYVILNMVNLNTDANTNTNNKNLYLTNLSNDDIIYLQNQNQN
jgi:hypothetical protein